MVNVSRLSNAMRAAGIMRRCVLESVVARARPRGVRAARSSSCRCSARACSRCCSTPRRPRPSCCTPPAALDRADAGSAADRALVRILTPLAKYWITASRARRRRRGDERPRRQRLHRGVGRTRGCCATRTSAPSGRARATSSRSTCSAPSCRTAALDALAGLRRRAAATVTRAPAASRWVDGRCGARSTTVAPPRRRLAALDDDGARARRAAGRPSGSTTRSRRACSSPRASAPRSAPASAEALHGRALLRRWLVPRDPTAPPSGRADRLARRARRLDARAAHRVDALPSASIDGERARQRDLRRPDDQGQIHAGLLEPVRGHHGRQVRAGG